MGKQLFIAEKPSVAAEFAKALKVNGGRRDGYLESDQYVVTWCVGHLITTYKTNGNPIPSFEGEPIRWDMAHEKFDEWANHVWEALNEDNKVSLYTCHMNIETGETKTMIFNKNK